MGFLYSIERHANPLETIVCTNRKHVHAITFQLRTVSVSRIAEKRTQTDTDTDR